MPHTQLGYVGHSLLPFHTFDTFPLPSYYIDTFPFPIYIIIIIIICTSAAVFEAVRTLKKMWFGQYCVIKMHSNFFTTVDVEAN